MSLENYDRVAGRILASGQLVVVFDRYKTSKLWSPSKGVPDCMSGMTARLKEETPGAYDVVFLHDNMESLLAAAAKALGDKPPETKRTPDQRDRLLGRLSWASLDARTQTPKACPSFGRLVARVAEAIKVPRT